MMTLNISKCQVISFHKNHSPIKFDYIIDNNVLKRAYTVNDLGVVFDTSLSFQTHIHSITVESPYYDVHIQTLERVQNRFLRIISYKSHLNSNNSTISLDINLPSLETRRIHSSIILLFNLLHNNLESNDLVSNISFHVPPRNTRNNILFHLPKKERNYTYFTPIL
ncbi:hypothetical protein J437_LFUL018929, partial [Ladona fulva]